jgi:uncharacterized membrane-anchored protein
MVVFHPPCNHPARQNRRICASPTNTAHAPPPELFEPVKLTMNNGQTQIEALFSLFHDISSCFPDVSDWRPAMALPSGDLLQAIAGPSMGAGTCLEALR